MQFWKAAILLLHAFFKLIKKLSLIQQIITFIKCFIEDHNIMVSALTKKKTFCMNLPVVCIRQAQHRVAVLVLKLTQPLLTDCRFIHHAPLRLSGNVCKFTQNSTFHWQWAEQVAIVLACITCVWEIRAQYAIPSYRYDVPVLLLGLKKDINFFNQTYLLLKDDNLKLFYMALNDPRSLKCRHIWKQNWMCGFK